MGERGAPTTLRMLVGQWESFAARMDALPTDLMQMTEAELAKRLQPTDIMQRLKIKFWDEYNRAFREGEKMHQGKVCEGVCDKYIFLIKVTQNPLAVAWICHPPADELIVRRQMIKMAHEKLLEVVQLPIYEERRIKVEGKDDRFVQVPNIPLIKEIRAILEGMENRVYGSVVHRAQIQTQEVPAQLTATSIADLDLALEKIQAAKAAATGLLPETLEAEVTDGQ